jgi:hypothetical protein
MKIYICYLFGGVTAAIARKDVAVHMSHASVPSVVDVAGSIGVGLSSGAVHTGNNEVITIIVHALQRAERCSLGKIHTHSGGRSGSEQTNKSERSLQHVVVCCE